MFNKLFKKKYTINRHFSAPLLQERLKYLNYWLENGAVKRNIFGIAEYLLTIIDYLNLEIKHVITTLEIEKAAKKWASRPYNKSRRKHSYRQSAESHFIWHATQWLKMIGRLKCPVNKKNHFSKEISQYINYMRNEKGLSEQTINSHCYKLNNFLSCVIKNKINSLHKLSTLIIENILIEKCNINGYSRTTIQTYASTIRAFLTYAEQRKWVSRELANTIKTPRTHKYVGIPSGPSWDDVKKLLASTENNNPIDIRDRAILMLLAIYALRRSEIVNLRLDDIDWKSEIIFLRRSKNYKLQKFPLSQSVGHAILRYLKEVRPNKCLYREIFTSTYAPLRPLKPASIFDIVNRRWKKLNIHVEHRGPHAIRHACATYLINKGVSLKEIGDHLGQQNLEATRIYAKVDIESLRKVADFDIGDLL